MFTFSGNKHGLSIKPLKFNIHLEIKMVNFPIQPKWSTITLLWWNDHVWIDILQSPWEKPDLWWTTSQRNWW